MFGKTKGLVDVSVDIHIFIVGTVSVTGLTGRKAKIFWMIWIKGIYSITHTGIKYMKKQLYN